MEDRRGARGLGGVRAVFDAAEPDQISPAEQNRALAGLLAMKELASRTGHQEVAAEVTRRAGRLRAHIVEEFRRGAGSLVPRPSYYEELPAVEPAGNSLGV